MDKGNRDSETREEIAANLKTEEFLGQKHTLRKYANVDAMLTHYKHAVLLYIRVLVLLW